MIEPDPLPAISNLDFVEQLYERHLQGDTTLPEEWRRYFSEMDKGQGNGGRRPSRLGPSFRPRSIFNPGDGRTAGADRNGEHRRLTSLQDRVDQMLRAYRTRGHMIAELDPLGMPRPCPPELQPEFYEFTPADMDLEFSCETVHPEGHLTLRDLHARLRNTYCRSVGVEYMHINDLSIRRWLQSRMEQTENRLALDREEQVRILTRLTDAVVFEEFIRRKYVGAKSFSLEGSESLIPLLDLAIERAGEQGIREIVLGMAHRGRLNVLANIMAKHPRQIFREFEDADPEHYLGAGDVKYHLGHSCDYTTQAGRKVHLSLCFNPSHLEFVNPVALGRVRSKQDRANDKLRTRGMALLIHGDASFAGQGVVQESLNLSQLDGYTTGGTLHVVVNNQIGFTTPPEEGRSSAYATDVAKLLQIPIWHVNGEDPEGVAQVVKLAMEFRLAFKRDVVIDMYGYRRLGHNEGDEPAFTQPVLYTAIKRRKSVREGYLDHLLKLGGVSPEEADEIAANRRALLEEALSEARSESYRRPDEPLRGCWASYRGGAEPAEDETETGVDRTRLVKWLEVQAQPPRGFHPHPKIKKLLATRLAMAHAEQPLDWSAAEYLALASLLTEGHRVRLTGQDTARGTFSQRHAILHDYADGTRFIPLQHLAAGQAPVEIINSPLSEAGALGFEYGYSLDCPEGLICWEAQFGDFWNGAQVIVDQFIASAEDKWRRLSGLVLLLPHGFEGQGPEHSSARMERFLSLAAEDNLHLVYPTTPAQYFHVLRRQILRPWRKPLVILTPKSLLRHPKVNSTLDELASSKFQRVLPDRTAQPERIRRILLCTGKLYYDLEEFREKNQRHDVAVIRLEQLYPLPKEELRRCLAPYPSGTPAVWVQEEPENMGAWHYLLVQFYSGLFKKHPFSGVYRPSSASPATGSTNSHRREQADLIEHAFGVA